MLLNMLLNYPISIKVKIPKQKVLKKKETQWRKMTTSGTENRLLSNLPGEMETLFGGSKSVIKNYY